MNLHHSITPEVIASITNAVNTGDTAELYDSYCEHYKDAHGIKARWVYGNTYTAEQWVSMFSMLAYDVDASIAADEAHDAAFHERIASLGLSEWAERNGIRDHNDLMDYNYRHEYMSEAA